MSNLVAVIEAQVAIQLSAIGSKAESEAAARVRKLKRKLTAAERTQLQVIGGALRRIAGAPA